MARRKENVAAARKDAMKSTYIARLNNVPTSPRKMRLVADLIRGQEVFKALNILRFTNKEAAGRLEKLLRSAIANYEKKSGSTAQADALFVKTVMVDSATMLKRISAAPQGRAHRIRKRSNHVTLIIDEIKTA
ncbi:MAG: 50S ribosomal protein L22 [Bacteroidia bacterium]|jgi:large subunit ribosomal protein L22|nr:50S ribosomal protein L22 [Bacteroidia bacterium]